MTDNKGFIFYRSFYEACKNLPEDEFKKCMLSLMKYGLDGVYEPDGAVATMFLAMAKPQIDANMKRRENGKKGGRPVEEKPKVKRFIPPTLEQVKEYCEERKNTVSPEAFMDFYSANGWVQGKSRKPIKDWKACVRTWEKSEKSNGMKIPLPDWWKEEY